MSWFHLVAAVWLLQGDPSVLSGQKTEIHSAPLAADGSGRFQLAPGEQVTVLEIERAGVIRELVILPPLGLPAEAAGTAVRLVATWDQAATAAVNLPLRDLFGAVTGLAGPVASELAQVTDGAWVCKLPMPFAQGARLELANDSARTIQLGFRCTLERWAEPSPEWARLQTTWRRQLVDLPGAGMLLEADQGPGQVVGLHLDLTSSVGEAVLDGDLVWSADGDPVAVAAAAIGELLRHILPGHALDAGLTVFERPDWRLRVAGYRSFLSAPLAWRERCELALAWSHEAAANGEADLTSTVIWYGQPPLVRNHVPMPYGERLRRYLGSAAQEPPEPAVLAKQLIPDGNPLLLFETPADLARVSVTGAAGGDPRWIDRPAPGPGNPHPGVQGCLGLQPAAAGTVARLAWKVLLPAPQSVLEFAFSPDPYEAPDKTDVTVRIQVYDGRRLRLLRQLLLLVEAGPSDAGWHRGQVALGPVEGGEALILIDLIPGGTLHAWLNEELFIDRLEVKPVTVAPGG